MKTLNALVISDDNTVTGNLLLALKKRIFILFISNPPVYIKPTCRKIADIFIDLDVDILFIRFQYWSEELRSVLYMLKNPPHVVFLSAESEKFTDYLSEEFPLHLKEPYHVQHIDHVLHALERNDDKDFQFLVVKYQRRYRKIPFSSIRQITSKGGYVTIHTPRENFMIAYALYKLKHKLPDQEFVQVNPRLILPRRSINQTIKIN